MATYSRGLPRKLKKKSIKRRRNQKDAPAVNHAIVGVLAPDVGRAASRSAHARVEDAQRGLAVVPAALLVHKAARTRTAHRVKNVTKQNHGGVLRIGKRTGMTKADGKKKTTANGLGADGPPLLKEKAVAKKRRLNGVRTKKP